MLTSLSIRDIVLIDRLDLSFGRGLTVLTGETGAGKSILLDSLGLATGARAESGLARTGTEQGSVTAAFSPAADHPAFALLASRGVEAEGEIVLRRVLSRDGRSRAFANDQPIGAALLRELGALLIEVQGQHDQQGLADPANHAALLDAFGVKPALGQAAAGRHRAWREALAALVSAKDAVSAAERDRDWLEHSVAELTRLAPTEGEEERLAADRQRLQQNEKHADAIAQALSELSSRDRRNPGPAASLRAASRSLQRLIPAGSQGPSPADEAMAAIGRAEEALSEAETLLGRLASDAQPDPRQLEAAEERLFALRAAARKHGISVAELTALFSSLSDRLAALEGGVSQLDALEKAAALARAAYVAACAGLTEARRAAGGRLDRAIAQELRPLRLDRARFVTEIAELPEGAWGAGGSDRVRFLISTNPGQEPGPLEKIASGGELSRLMLALKVVLVGGSSVPTLVFDEVDSGIGGATAAAVGERLARVADGVQVLLVTHSPQVAARGTAHLRVSKQNVKGRAATLVEALTGEQRREEIARMLAGETVTAAARAAADSLLGAA